MTAEQQFFLRMISDHIHCRKTSQQDGLNWDQIAFFAKSHEIVGILYAQCADWLVSIEPEIYKKLQYGSYVSTAAYLNNVQAVKVLTKALNVKWFMVKGLEIASLYPVPAYRSMGDLDLVMSTEDREEIIPVMEGLGYKLKRGYEHSYSTSKSKLEVHDHLIYEENLDTAVRRNYFNSFWNYVEEQNGQYRLKREFHFLFLIEHTKQHFTAHGIGFRQFLDVAISASKWSDMDWQWIKGELQKLDLLQFAETTLSFCKKWWGINPSISVPEIADEMYNKSTEFIFSNGVFGFNNENHELYTLEKKLSLSRLPSPLRKADIIAKKVFIPYEWAADLSYCSFVRDRKYLLPAVWMYRLYYLAKNRMDTIEKNRKALFGSDDVIKEHRELMVEWGL